MLSQRAETILKSIVGQYITRATPVPSHSVVQDCELGVSPATVRNEMVRLEQEGYISRHHTSAGSVPLDKGYRHYVESLGEVKLPVAEQRLISHLFHQVEKELEEWLELAASIIAQRAQNIAVVTTPRTEACRFKHLELVSLQDYLVLLVLVLQGARVKQQLMALEQVVPQSELTVFANKLNGYYSGLTASQVSTRGLELSVMEQQVTDCILGVMQEEDTRDSEGPFLDGLHFTLDQPEFVQDRRVALSLMELVEQRTLLRSIVPSESARRGVQVIIGRENKSEHIQQYSVVIGRYGAPDEAVGSICVVGPTRMPYGRTIATVDYLSSVLSSMVARLYGKAPVEPHPDSVN